MKNFEFEHEGEKLWYSRSLACACIVFGRNLDGKLHVLANKRGNTEFNPHMWNVPGGFIDFDEDAIDCAIRETYEETGLVLEREQLTFLNFDSSPIGKRQTLSVRYVALVNDTPIEYVRLSAENCEENEVERISWLPVETDSDMGALFKLKWTRDQIKNIIKAKECVLNGKV